MELTVDPKSRPLFHAENFGEFWRHINNARDAAGIRGMHLRSIHGFVILETSRGGGTNSSISFPTHWFLRSRFKSILLGDLDSFMASMNVFPLEV